MNIDNQIALLIERKKEIEEARANTASAFAKYVDSVFILSGTDPTTAKALKLGIIRNYCTLTGKPYEPLMLKSIPLAEIIIRLDSMFGEKVGEPND